MNPDRPQPPNRYAFLKPDDGRDGLIAWPSELRKLASAADAEAIDRILAAVGRDHIPPGLDRKALCADIADAYHSRDHAFDLVDGSNAQDQLKLLRRIRKTAEKLASLLSAADTTVDATIATCLDKITPAWGKIAPPLGSPAAPKPIEQLDRWLRAIEMAEGLRERAATKWRIAHKHDRDLRGRRVTEKEWLAGVSLPLVFEWHFRERAGRSRSKAGEPTGPMLRFIGAMKELGLPYSDESIMRAYSLRAPLRAEQRKGQLSP
jgi:hypothetical protein